MKRALTFALLLACCGAAPAMAQSAAESQKVSFAALMRMPYCDWMMWRKKPMDG